MLTLYLSIMAGSVIYADDKVQEFKYQSQLTGNVSTDSEMFLMNVSPQTFAVMNEAMNDLRVFNKNGNEVGWTRINPVDSSGSTQYTMLTVINQGMLAGSDSYSFTVKDIPPNDGSFRVKLNQPEYLVKAKVLGSNDNRSWQIIGNQTLYGINGNYNDFSLHNVDYHYLKFDFSTQGENFKVMEVGYTSQGEDAITNRYLPFAIKESKETAKSYILVDLAYLNRNSTGLKLVTAEKNFYRKAFLQASNDGESWEQVTDFYLFRGGDDTDTNLNGILSLVAEKVFANCNPK